MGETASSVWLTRQDDRPIGTDRERRIGIEGPPAAERGRPPHDRPEVNPLGAPEAGRRFVPPH